jgi:hypothetical protein
MSANFDVLRSVFRHARASCSRQCGVMDRRRAQVFSPAI